MKPTRDQVRRVKKNPWSCPICGTASADCRNYDDYGNPIPKVLGHLLTLPMRCSNCSSEWDVVYSASGLMIDGYQKME